MISRYSTKFYNNVTLYGKVLFRLKMCEQQQKVHFKKAFKIKPSKRKNQADCANYSTEWATYTRVSLY